ncbi:microbial Terpene synthase-like protein 1 [Selaginella moellendorffii]|uniref:microbial Terpene synthase-like protein 1 n=1 Tax=Selaginella moellendorffii TaxID=88036 RepID=UPI000D1C53B2|nr:microbial Terpene synthase-like protein 1 [Selaginella moellendorffii]|eukprot:XP_024521034.1 microbial Terpene synthase-like protein 1 [Selaginella moellendorffii]
MGPSSILSIFEGAKSFYIPPHSSYHVDLNPAKLDAEIDKWCMDFLNLHDLTDHKTQFAIQSKLGKLAGLAYQAISSERLRPMAKFLCWLFLADDFMDNPSVPVSDLKNATLAYKLIFKNDYDQAITLVESKDLLRQMGMLNDVYTDLKGFMNPGHRTRFSKSMIDVLDMFEVESSWLHKKLVPNFEIYNVTAGVIPCMVAIDFLNNFGLEDDVLDHPNIQRLEVIANRHTYLANDMVSFKKEWACDMYLNSVALVGYSSNCGLHEAMEKVAQMVQDLEKEFADIKQKVLSNKDLNKGNVMGYVQGLEYFMAGNIGSLRDIMGWDGFHQLRNMVPWSSSLLLLALEAGA